MSFLGVQAEFGGGGGRTGKNPLQRVNGKADNIQCVCFSRPEAVTLAGPCSCAPYLFNWKMRGFLPWNGPKRPKHCCVFMLKNFSAKNNLKIQIS